MRKTIIKGATLVLPGGTRRTPLYLADGLISPAFSPQEATQLDLDGHLIFPGLVNAHDHLHVNCVPPLPRAARFPNSYAWIERFDSHLSTPAVAAARAIPLESRYFQGGLKNLLAGATTAVHHDPWHPALDDPLFPVRLLREFGWAHSLGLAPASGFAAGRSNLKPFGPPVLQSYCATPTDRPWMMHLAEGTDEVAAEELPRLDALRCLASNTVLIHGVGLSNADVDLILRRRAAVVWCPSSNLAILGSTLRPRRLFEAGRLALGNDSRLTGARDLLEELRVAAAHSDLAPRELLRLATADAARVIREPGVGGLEPGQYADLLVIRDRRGDPYEQLLETRRSEVAAVICGGMPAIADPDFAHWFSACQLEAIRVRLDGRLKLLRPLGSDVLDLEPGLERAA